VHNRPREPSALVGRPSSLATGLRRPEVNERVKRLWNLRKETRGGADELVFAADRGGRIIRSNMMRRVLKPAAVEAGLGTWAGTGRERRADTWVGFHTFRHTCATMLFRAGWNAVQVQKFLGHSDPGFTLRTYVHLLPEDLPEPPSLDTTHRNHPRHGYPLRTGTAASAEAPRQAEIALAYS
jgi:integrase